MLYLCLFIWPGHFYPKKHALQPCLSSRSLISLQAVIPMLACLISSGVEQFLRGSLDRYTF